MRLDIGRKKAGCILLCLFIIFIFLSCGGGGGRRYPPKVTINKSGIVKESASEINSDKVSILIADISLDKVREELVVEKVISKSKFSGLFKCKFQHKDYVLGSNSYKVCIIDSQGKIIKKLKTPRYSTRLAALELVGKKKISYLAIFIQQQATSGTSTLYILNKDFDVVYKEHLLTALWIARKSTKTGDNLIVSSDNGCGCCPSEKCISTSGPRRYLLFTEK